MLRSLLQKHLYYAATRYMLSLPMMIFGVMKILGRQFHTMPPPLSAYGQPLEYLSGVQLTWAFLGYAPWFQVLLGIFEFVPAAMLLFRRTALLGAIFLFPMTLSVMLINYGMHLWSDTKFSSLAFVLLNVLIFLFEWKRVKALLGIALDTSKKYKFGLPELVIALALISFAVVRKTLLMDKEEQKTNALLGDWYHGRSNEFTLISEKINDSLLPHHSVKAYFGPKGSYSELNDVVNNRNGYGFYYLDEQDHILTLPDDYKYGNTDRSDHYYLSGEYFYQLRGDTLELNQTIDTATNHTLLFRKRLIRMNDTY